MLVLEPASTASTSFSVTMSGSLLVADTFGISDETPEEEDVGTWGRAFVWAAVDTSDEAELCTCGEITADVCVVETGGTVWVVAAVVATTVATDTGVAVVVDTLAVVTIFVVTTVMDFSEDDAVLVTVDNEAGVAPLEVVTGGGILTIFSAVVAGVVEVVCSLEGAAATGVFTWTPSVGGDDDTVTDFALAVVVTIADVVVGEGVQVRVGVGGFAEDVPAN